MKKIIAIGLIPCCLLLAGCGAKKKVVHEEPVTETVEQEPAWHTCLIQSARGSVFTNTDRFSATLTMQTVRDSMIVISVMPMLGIEMFRIEATPLEIIAIDKMHGQYGMAGFAELNRKLTPNLNWDILQQITTAELPTGSDRARLQYQFGEDFVELVIDYPQRQLDVPVRVGNMRLDRYTRVDVTKFL